jgi:hypothetical protein
MLFDYWLAAGIHFSPKRSRFEKLKMKLTTAEN